MNKDVLRLLKTIEDDNLVALIGRIQHWLTVNNDGSITASRAKALLLASNALDETLLNDFERVVADAKTTRLALYDLLALSGLKVDEISTYPTRDAGSDWLTLGINAFAWKLEYAVADLDPTSPPSQFSPAGQVVHQTGNWVRRQVQRSATERDQMAKKLAFSGQRSAVSGQPPATSHQPPAQIPVRYYEYNDPVEVDPNEPVPTPVQRATPILITEDDLVDAPAPLTVTVEPEPDVKIVGESRVVSRPQQNRSQSSLQTPSALAGDVRRVAGSARKSAETLLSNVRQNFQNEEMKSTRLQVSVTQYPDGPGLPGVQVYVRYKNSKDGLAGTTNAEGHFTCSLPVRQNSGLTYNVQITWPSEYGGKKERKMITLNADRTEFDLPFYARLHK